jgi:hypothetical protein
VEGGAFEGEEDGDAWEVESGSYEEQEGDAWEVEGGSCEGEEEGSYEGEEAMVEML